MTNKTIPLRLTALLAAGILALSGCAAQAAPTEEDPEESTATAGESVTMTDAWAKAADSGMSAAFGTLTNDSAEEITVVSAESAASSSLELHETVENESGQSVMREIDGGFTIPAGGDLVLEPGGNHLMLMDLTAPLEAGAEATFVLTFSDDSTFEFTAPVKDYSGANETYEGDDMDMDDMDHGDMDMDSEGSGDE